MPEHIRALIVILALAAPVFAFAKAPACGGGMAAADFDRRRNAWVAITLAAFLAHSFWLFIIAASAVLALAAAREHNKLALFFFLLFAVPPLSAEIPGFGGIKHLFAVHHIRLLALVVLLPAFLSLRRQQDVERFGSTLPDKLLIAYLLLNLLLMFAVSTFTNTLRHGVFYAFIDVFLPYYVASRGVKDLKAFRDVALAFVLGALLLAVVGIFEVGKYWLLYSTLDDSLGVPRTSFYLEREGLLRAEGSTGQPIPFGYVMAVALGLCLYLRPFFKNAMTWLAGCTLLLLGLVASLSRGPWVGAAVIGLAFVACGRSAAMRFSTLGLLAIVGAPVLIISPMGEHVLDYLPFVGTVGESNVTYRKRLLEAAIQVLMQNPVFGAFDYVHSPAIQDLRQGQGIIDIVNSYVGVALGSGLIGLVLYAGFFITILIGILRGMSQIPNKAQECYVVGQTLLATLLGILVIIFTVSSISVIPTIYWSVAGLGVAFYRKLARSKVHSLHNTRDAQPYSRSPKGYLTPSRLS